MTTQHNLSNPAARAASQTRPRSGVTASLFAALFFLLGLNPLNSWAEEPVNINLASAEILAETLDGVGLAKAYRIIEYREAHGPFVHIEELAAVQGIGMVTVEKNRGVIRLQ